LSSLPKDFYSTDYFTGKLIDQFKTSGTQKPFFAYLAFTAPHWPLHAHHSDIAKYRGRYDAGFEVLRTERLARQQKLGLIAPGVAPHSLKHPKGGWAD